MFSAQEIIISFFYVRAACCYLHSRFAKKNDARGPMTFLVLIQAVVVAADVAIVVIDLLGYLKVKTFVHSFVYIVKLELEFVTINHLVELSKMGLHGAISWSPITMGNGPVGGKTKATPDSMDCRRDPTNDLELELSNASWGSGRLHH